MRAKQLFYEFDCDYYVLDANGSGIGAFDIATKETEDPVRGEIYPAWTVINPDDLDKRQRTLDENAVPVIYAAPSNGIANKSRMLLHSRDIFGTNKISILVDTQDGLDYLN
nr:MAG TPA: large terminase [Caudoviricetes sp.]